MTIRELAKEKLVFSKLAIGRTSIESTDIAKKYPKGITVTKVEPVQFKGKLYYNCLFEEDDTRFFGTGMVLTDLFTEIIEENYEGDYSEFNDALSNEGGLHIKMTVKKSGNSDFKYVGIEVI